MFRHIAHLLLANRQVACGESVQSDEKIYCAIRTPELCGVALNTLKWNQAAVKTYKRKRLIIYVHERMHSPMYDYIQRASALITYQAPFGGLDNTTSNLSVACCAGGATRNRTGDKGFADLCLTAWLWRRIQFLKKSTDRIARSVDHWSGLRGSNSLPPPWQGGALPDELHPQNKDRNAAFKKVGASGRNRTNDTRIFSPLLYQLSYRGKYGDPDRARTDDL